MSEITDTVLSSLLASYLAGSDTCERGRLIRIQYYWRNGSFMYAFWSKWTRNFHITCKYTVFWRIKNIFFYIMTPSWPFSSTKTLQWWEGWRFVINGGSIDTQWNVSSVWIFLYTCYVDPDGSSCVMYVSSSLTLLKLFTHTHTHIYMWTQQSILYVRGFTVAIQWQYLTLCLVKEFATGICIERALLICFCNCW